jgi:acyl dehydratase
MDRVRFLRPVFFGDTIHLKTTITEKASVKDGSGLISVNVEVLNQRGETVMAAVMKFVVRARDLVSA